MTFVGINGYNGLTLPNNKTMKKAVSILILCLAVVFGAMPSMAQNDALQRAFHGTAVGQRTINGPQNAKTLDALRLTKRGGMSMANMMKIGRHAKQSPFQSRTLPMSLAKKSVGGLRAPFKANAMPKTINAVLYYTSGSLETGMYSFTTASNAMTLIKADYDLGVCWGAEANNVYYGAINGFMSYITRFDISKDWEEMDYGTTINNSTSLGTCATKDPTSGIIYGCFFTSDGKAYTLSTFSTETLKPTAIGSMRAMYALGCTSKGELYGVGDDNNLYKIDKTTGATTLIGATNTTGKNLTSGAIDPETDIFYYAVNNDTESYLCQVDLATGNATRIYDFADEAELTGMYIPAPLAEEKAPGAPTDLSLSFPAGSLTGTVQFNAPATLYDGQAGSGALTYEISVNGEVVKTGQTAFLATVSEQVTLATSGQKEFQVTVSNQAGTSPKLKGSLYVGQDTPKPVTNVLLSYDGTKMRLTWNAVTEGVNGGYIDPMAVTYNVSLNGVAKAQGITATEFEEAYTEGQMESVQYSVTAVYGGLESGAALSNALSMGILTLPYTNDFSSKNALSGFTVLDLNQDKYTWKLSNDNYVYIEYSTQKMNDWLISPKFRVEAGKIYTVSLKAKCEGYGTKEAFAVMIGDRPEASALTGEVVGVTEIENTDFETFTGTYTATETKNVYLGIHGCSEADQYTLYVDDLSISQGREAKSPAAASGLSVVANPSGELTAEVSFTAPSVDLEGNTLQSLTNIVVKRNGEVVKTFDNPAAGSALSFTDNVTEAAEYTYSVVAANAYGESDAVEASAFIGVNKPAAPENVEISEVGNTGRVHISWQKPTKDVNGYDLPNVPLTYIVAGVNADGTGLEVIEQGLTDTSYDLQAVAEGAEQQFVYYAIFASTSAGMGDGVPTAQIPVGTPYEMPLYESFNGGQLHHLMGVDAVSGSASAQLYKDGDIAGFSSQDGDGYYMGTTFQALNDVAALYSGKINVGAAQNPVLSFFYYTLASDNTNATRVYIIADGKQTLVKEIASMGGTAAWQKVTIDLSAYKGKTIQWRLEAVCNGYTCNLYDNFFVGDQPLNDLGITSITAPVRKPQGESFNIDVTLRNYGTLEAANYTVSLYKNGALKETKTGSEIAPDGTLTLSFSDEMQTIDQNGNQYYAVVEIPNDENSENNTSPKKTVLLKENNFPAASGLTATLQGSVAHLSWTAPDLAQPAQQETEDFESYDSFAINDAGDWQFIDGDKGDTYGFQDGNFPGNGSPMAYILFDASGDFADEELAAHSGTKYMACFSSASVQNDDWLISPCLTGEAQTVSFYAKSFMSKFMESFEIYYSLTGAEKSDFQLLTADQTAAATWTQYSAALPEGAKYFAIRCVSNDKFIFLVDDVTFTRKAPGEGLTLLGYDVYRNGVKLNTSLITDTQYDDATVDASQSQQYVVVAVYDKGDSPLSNVADLQTTGIAAVADNGAQVVSQNGVIEVSDTGGERVTIATLDGKTAYQGKPQGRLVVRARKGVYVVKIGSKTRKVALK